MISLMHFIASVSVSAAQNPASACYPGAPAFVIAWCAVMLARRMLFRAYLLCTGR